MNAVFNVGIDVGSTTIKLVVLDKAKQIVYKNYERHFSEIGHALHENLASLKKVVGEQKFNFALTGSAGMGIAQRIGLPFVQEVIACAAAVKEPRNSSRRRTRLSSSAARMRKSRTSARRRSSA